MDINLTGTCILQMMYFFTCLLSDTHHFKSLMKKHEEDYFSGSLLTAVLYLYMSLKAKGMSKSTELATE